MTGNKIKHLEFLQNVITRMNSNSFLIKGWTITIISALLALSSKDTNMNYFYISFIVIPTFWILDGFYLSQERQYRVLYNLVCSKTDVEIDFNMDASGFNKGDKTWFRSTLSNTLLFFYGISSGIILTIIFFIHK
jgi:hypothetical protein